MKEVKRNDKIIGRIHFPCLSYRSDKSGRSKLLRHLSKNIKDSEKGYAGLKSRESLEGYLKKAVFNENDIQENHTFDLNESEITKTIAESLGKCFQAITGETVDVFVFPTFSRFVKEEMSGTSGYCPWRDTILVFIYPDNFSFQSLSETIGHEFNHAVFLRYKRCETILDSLIMEGLAEHFRERVIGGQRAPWTEVFGPNKVRELFSEIKEKGLLESADPEIRRGLFFGNENYSRWSGYTIGYCLARSFLGNNTDLSWPEIMAKKLEEIGEGSGWGK